MSIELLSLSLIFSYLIIISVSDISKKKLKTLYDYFEYYIINNGIDLFKTILLAPLIYALLTLIESSLKTNVIKTYIYDLYMQFMYLVKLILKKNIKN
jgi:hypothetical protein